MSKISMQEYYRKIVAQPEYIIAPQSSTRHDPFYELHLLTSATTTFNNRSIYF